MENMLNTITDLYIIFVIKKSTYQIIIEPEFKILINYLYMLFKKEYDNLAHKYLIDRIKIVEQNVIHYTQTVSQFYSNTKTQIEPYYNRLQPDETLIKDDKKIVSALDTIINKSDIKLSQAFKNEINIIINLLRDE